MQYKFDNLNSLENEIHTVLYSEINSNPTLKIVDAAVIAAVSPSKISKFCQKLGFNNYKQYKEYILTGSVTSSSPELERISMYIKKFDSRKAMKLARLITKYDRIILHGIGPSLIAVEYLAYRLRIHTTKDIITTSDDFFINTNINTNTLVVIYSVTGTFRSFNSILTTCSAKNTEYIVVCEENTNQKEFLNRNILYLTDTKQDLHPLAYEKTRTLWFIYIEEVISRLIEIQSK